jgi:peptide/nickel transport system substrate-binding protein
VQAELKPLGINVKIVQQDPNTASDNDHKLNYDMYFSYWTMDIPDPDELVTFAVDPGSGAKSFFTAYNLQQPCRGEGYARRRADADHQRQAAALQHYPGHGGE